MSDVHAELSGSVFRIEVAVGDRVEAGQSLAILESMKMEIPIVADRAGIVSEMLISQGEMVDEGAVVVRLSD